MKAMHVYMVSLCLATFFVLYRMAKFQYQQTELDTRFLPFDTAMESDKATEKVGHLPRGIVQATSDLEVKPLWSNSYSLKDINQNNQYLLAIPVGIKQKRSVDAIVRKFLPENFTVILFHYDGDVNGWHDLQWSDSVIHIAAHNQTKWWFAKRFLHPDVTYTYDYIFLWDEDLEVQHFHPGRYLRIIKSEGLDISQPALDPNLSEIHHRITVRRNKGNLHRNVYITHTTGKCSNATEGPPCTGWVEGMAPVFSRSAWRCVWYLIQNDLVHGWGMDMKLGYCAQGDPTKKVGVIDTEFVIHRGIQTLGGSGIEKSSRHLKDLRRHAQVSKRMLPKIGFQSRRTAVFDARTKVRRQARSELVSFQERWDEAVRKERDWVDPFHSLGRRRKNRGKYY